MFAPGPGACIWTRTTRAKHSTGTSTFMRFSSPGAEILLGNRVCPQHFEAGALLRSGSRSTPGGNEGEQVYDHITCSVSSRHAGPTSGIAASTRYAPRHTEQGPR